MMDASGLPGFIDFELERKAAAVACLRRCVAKLDSSIRTLRKKKCRNNRTEERRRVTLERKETRLSRLQGFIDGADTLGVWYLEHEGLKESRRLQLGKNQGPIPGPDPSPIAGQPSQLPNNTSPVCATQEDAELRALAQTALLFQTPSIGTSTTSVSHLSELERMSMQTADMAVQWTSNPYGSPSQGAPPWNSTYVSRLAAAAQRGGSVSMVAEGFFPSFTPAADVWHATTSMGEDIQGIAMGFFDDSAAVLDGEF